MNEVTLFNPLFDDDFGFCLPRMLSPKAAVLPKVDVKETKDAYVLDMDLPGSMEKDVDVNLKDDVLTISSQKEETNEKKDNAENGRWLLHERHSYSFSRSFTLPTDVNQEGIKASFKNGVLEVRLPRKEAAKPQKIAIDVA